MYLEGSLHPVHKCWAVFAIFREVLASAPLQKAPSSVLPVGPAAAQACNSDVALLNGGTLRSGAWGRTTLPLSAHIRVQTEAGPCSCFAS